VPEQRFICKFFPNREKPVFITGIPANENRFLPVGKNLQGKPCFHYRDGFAVRASTDSNSRHLILQEAKVLAGTLDKKTGPHQVLEATGAPASL
jgi:hypothetical protein